MSSAVDRMLESKNELLTAEARSAKALRRLKHTKADLETLLMCSVAEIEFKPEGEDKYRRIVCTSNKRLVNVFKAKKPKDRDRALTSPFAGMRTRDRNSVLTYDLEEGSLKTVSLKSWRAVNFVMLTEDNVLVLDALLKECLRR